MIVKQDASITRDNLHRTFLALLLLVVLEIFFSAGCGGGGTDCSVAQALAVAPQSATADHLASPPGNQISFVAGDAPPPGCPPTPGPLRTDLKWSVSDPVNVTIGNTQGVDYGVATCKNATAGAVTVTATGTNKLNATITGTASLTCN
jgi:hypothetical protein